MTVIGQTGRRAFQRLRVVRPPHSTTTTSQTPDGTPDAFSFTDVTNASLSTLETSNTITVSGINTTVSASISGDASSQVQQNGGAWGSGPLTVSNGDTLTVRHTSSPSNSTAVNTTLTIGGVSDTFTSTTVAATSSAGEPFGLLLALTKAA